MRLLVLNAITFEGIFSITSVTQKFLAQYAFCSRSENIFEETIIHEIKHLVKLTRNWKQTAL